MCPMCGIGAGGVIAVSLADKKRGPTRSGLAFARMPGQNRTDNPTENSVESKRSPK